MLVREGQTFHNREIKVKDKNKFVFIRGKAKWCRTVVPDPTYDKWSVCLYPLTSEMPKVQELIDQGIRNKLKKDDDGFHINFSRPIKIEKRNGTSTPLDPPRVVDNDGNVITEYVGDGSDVTVKLETYGGPGPGGRGSYKAARLDSIQVHTLVPYKMKEELQEKDNQPVPF